MTKYKINDTIQITRIEFGFCNCPTPQKGEIIVVGKIPDRGQNKNVQLYYIECMCKTPLRGKWIKEEFLQSFDGYNDFREKIEDRMF